MVRVQVAYHCKHIVQYAYRWYVPQVRKEYIAFQDVFGFSNEYRWIHENKEGRWMTKWMVRVWDSRTALFKSYHASKLSTMRNEQTFDYIMKKRGMGWHLLLQNRFSIEYKPVYSEFGLMYMDSHWIIAQNISISHWTLPTQLGMVCQIMHWTSWNCRLLAKSKLKWVHVILWPACLDWQTTHSSNLFTTWFGML